MPTEYRIIEISTGSAIATKEHRSDGLARRWAGRLLDDGIVAGLPVQLQRRLLADEQVASLPPFAGGQKRSAWSTI